MQTGFTLIELVVVVAIILILGAMLLPVLEQAMKQAESVTCLSNLRHVCLGALMYADDYDQQYPPAILDIPNSSYATCWDALLLPYLRSQSIFVCPADETPSPGPAWTYSIPHSYGINLDIAMVGGYSGASMRTTSVHDPAQTILFFELNSAQCHYGWSPSWAILGDLHEYVAARHRDGANFSFCGGNTKWLRLENTEDLWDP